MANVGLLFRCARETSRPCARLVSQSLFTGENLCYVAGWRVDWSARLNGILAFDQPARGLA